MVNKILSATFAFALLLTQAAHALPQASPPSGPSLPTPSPLRAMLDARFGDSDGSMDGVACSNGDNGLETQFPKFGNVPSFPFIGGAFDIDWGSPNCGSCWNVTNPSTGVSIQMTAIDSSGVGFNIAPEAFVNLTISNASSLVFDVVATKLSATPCPSESS